MQTSEDAGRISKASGFLLRRATGTHSSLAEEARAALRRTVFRLLLGLSVIVGLGLWAEITVDNSLKREAASQLQTHLQTSSAAVRLWLDGELAELSSLLTQDDLRDRLTDKSLGGSMKEFLGRTAAVGYVVTDAGGAAIFVSEGVTVPGRLPVPPAEYQRWLVEPKPRVWPPENYGTKQGPTPLLTLSVPLSDGSGRAVHLLRDPAKQFSEILMLARPGQTGETYAFDANGMMISRSRFKDEVVAAGLIEPSAKNTIGHLELRDPGVRLDKDSTASLPRSQQPLTHMVQSALSQGQGVDVNGYRDYRGELVLGAWTFFRPWGFGIASEIDAEEAFALRNGLRMVLGTLLVGLVLATFVGIFFAHLTQGLRVRFERAERKAERMGQYTLGKMLGQGGMGAVYEARHEMLRRPTAVKLIKAPEGGVIPDATLTRFEREVQMTAQLTHPNTIAIYDYGKTPDGVFYYAMEYLSGMDLEQLVEKYGPLPWNRAAYLVAQACGSLAEAHSREMVHRDVKPSNIMICERGGEYDRVKVLDFGLVKDSRDTISSTNVTQEGVLTGTPHYMAPEVLTNAKNASPQSDLYALGAVLYYAVSGQDLFPGRDIMGIMVAQMTEAPRPLTELVPKVDPRFAALVHSCLAKEPQNRPHSAAEVGRRLAELCRDHWDSVLAKSWWTQNAPLAANLNDADRSDVSGAVTVDPWGSTIALTPSKRA